MEFLNTPEIVPRINQPFALVSNLFISEVQIVIFYKVERTSNIELLGGRVCELNLGNERLTMELYIDFIKK